MTNKLKTITAAIAAAALVAPAAVAQKPADKPAKTDHTAKGKGQAKGKKAVFRGDVVSVDVAAGTLTIDPTGGNKRARTFAGEAETLSFDAASAKRLRTADHDGDDAKSLADFLAGHKAQILARVKDGEIVSVRKVQNKTPKAEETTVETETTESA